MLYTQTDSILADFSFMSRWSPCRACISEGHLICVHCKLLCLQEAPPGALDGYLDTVLPIMEADLFGDIADAKEADAFAAKYRSADFFCITQHP